jgi:hypothetical protein
MRNTGHQKYEILDDNDNWEVISVQNNMFW